MKYEDQIERAPAYCIRCGGSVGITQFERKRGQHYDTWQCPSYGYEGVMGGVPLKAVPDSRFHRILRAWRWRLRPRIERQSLAQHEENRQIYQEKGIAGLIARAHLPVLGLSADSNLRPLMPGR